ncbi:hypothetical protein MCOR08_002963 [Pyricularia oryzae]|nr:hypothetical protein MCOR32_006705 [Pyricularia oryzae]KAI6441477.1 hypothetical protein MCOR22_006501 [Pyricularia oryzae]KAI6563931.1 hypothetical protein MCOR04_009123 [Pyricularia oryzae]KAI6637717.1 hypothetical protein MCOR08_002963 [Pyricularia oryzae]
MRTTAKTLLPGMWYKTLVPCGHFIWRPSRAHGAAVPFQYEGIRRTHSASPTTGKLQPYPGQIESIKSVVERMRAVGIVLPNDKLRKIQTKFTKVSKKAKINDPIMHAQERAAAPVKELLSFSVSAWPWHRVTDIVQADYFSTPKPLTGRVASRLIHRSQTEPLWICTAVRGRSNQSLHINNCCQSIRTQQVKRAFQVALRMHGYDKHGRRFEESSDKPEQLYGTCNLVAHMDDAASIKKPVLVQYYYDIVGQLMPHLGCASGEIPPVPLHHRNTQQEGTE